MGKRSINMALGCRAAAVVMGALILLATGCKKGEVYRVTVGTYGEHIYTCEFNPHKNEFVQKEIAAARNASYALPAKGDNGKEYIFAVSESGNESGVYSFERDAGFVQTGHIQETGANPCFVMLYDGGKYMLTADYTGGSISAFPIGKGKVGNLCASLKFTGQGPDKARQASSHIHQLKALASGSGKWILATDLGADAIRLISAETDKGELLLTHKTDIPCPAGSGPRHMEFNADSTVLYCLAELSGEVLVYDINNNGDIPEFTLRQRILADETNARGSADIHIHPSGKWLYTSHRLSNDGIAIFNILPDSSLEKVGYTRTGRHPRNFMITDDGAYLFVACRDDKLIQIFEILPNGSLLLTGTSLHLEEDKPSSICGL
ncbi:MAG: lactonase family protein [Bacteroidales bacterium]|nr:lactonase family protein [Bacteroidales bacterium]